MTVPAAHPPRPRARTPPPRKARNDHRSTSRQRSRIPTALRIGHAYEYISSDALARFKRLDGHEVFFMTGTDEHSLKMQQTAIQRGHRRPRTRGSELHDVFQNLDKVLNFISYDRFIRTTDADHQVASKAILEKMAASGDIYLDTLSGWYSVRDEAFYTEAETTLLEDGTRQSTGTGTPVEWTEESNYTFRLSACRTVSSRCTKRAPRVHRPHDAPQRDRQLRQGRPQGPVDLTYVRLGRRSSTTRPRHVRLGRRALLPDRRGLPER